jgi:hypothetical protein
MSIMQTANSVQLIRTNVWADYVKERLEDPLIATKFAVNVDFPDGNTLNIPSIGQLVAQDYQEGKSVTFQSPDLGNFTFALTDYADVSFAITDKDKRDMFYYNQLMADIPVNMARALQVRIEQDILALSGSQTAANPNRINSFAHRFVASGSSQILTVADVRYARTSLIKANITPGRLVGIVDPSVELQLRADTTISASITNQPTWGDLLSEGLSGATGLQFKYNIEGFDIYTSNYLRNPGSEAIDAGSGSRNAGATAVSNMFFSADPMHKVFLYGVRKPVTVAEWRDNDTKQDKYSVDTEYGVALCRPEGLVVINTNVATSANI